MSDPKLPTDNEAEEWVVASLLIDPTKAAEVFSVVEVDHFHDELARAAIEAIHTAWARGEPIDVLFVVRKMREHGGEIAELAAGFLAECRTQYPTAANVLFYAQSVNEAHRKRQLLSLGNRLTASSLNGKPSADILGDLLNEASGMAARSTATGDPWARWEHSLDERDRLTYYKVGGVNSQLNRLCIGPGLFTLLGAPPGFGKTALALQVTVDSLLANDDLTALVANCEMDPGVLLDRQLARLSRVPYSVVRDRKHRGDAFRRVTEAVGLLRELKSRLHFMAPPFSMARVRALAASTGADIVVVDYCQRFKPTSGASDQRQQVSDVMSDCREIAMTGPAVIAVSAMSRQGQFRESSECEYACDTGFVIQEREDDGFGDDGGGKHLLAKCIKNRHGAVADIELEFVGKFQEMTAPHEIEPYEEFAEFGREAQSA